MPAALTAVLAHQGGWDEALYVAVPMAVLVGLLWVAQRRAQAEQDAQGEADDAGTARSPSPSGPPHPDEP